MNTDTMEPIEFITKIVELVLPIDGALIEITTFGDSASITVTRILEGFRDHAVSLREFDTWGDLSETDLESFIYDVELLLK